MKKKDTEKKCPVCGKPCLDDGELDIYGDHHIFYLDRKGLQLLGAKVPRSGFITLEHIYDMDREVKPKKRIYQVCMQCWDRFHKEVSALFYDKHRFWNWEGQPDKIYT